jgi:hypothetical protein
MCLEFNTCFIMNLTYTFHVAVENTFTLQVDIRKVEIYISQIPQPQEKVMQPVKKDILDSGFQNTLQRTLLKKKKKKILFLEVLEPEPEPEHYIQI